MIYQIAEIAYKEQKSLSEIRDDFNSKIEQDRMLEDKIKSNESKLKSNNVTSEELQEIKYLKNSLKKYGISEIDKIINFINNIGETDYDPAKLIQFASDHYSISQDMETVIRQKIEESSHISQTQRGRRLLDEKQTTPTKNFPRKDIVSRL